MKLNKFTDLGLRCLIYLSQPQQDKPFTIQRMAEELEVSHNHLVKVVHFLSKQGWILTVRGKGGGLFLHKPSLDLALGDIVATLEQSDQLVNCFEPRCRLIPYCDLNQTLQQAMSAFYRSLNQFTLADMIKKPVQLSAPVNTNRIMLQSI